MKTTISNKITSLGLAILVVFSTLSLTVEKHFCGDNLVDVAIFSNVEKCGMDKSSVTETITKSCCKDEVEVVKGLEDLKLNTFDNLSLDQLVFIQSFIYSYSILFESLPKEIIPHKNYSPPNIVKDIQLLDDVFLI
ncbi:MAG: hypothetical protein HKN40_00900 [Winogradskyella sp.]|uniref:HYC_CC_PP family protein n=1 Tax=Winogradskyella sp. TaxID=1883156 RepID=UPI00184A7EA3|nr:hypothetical protein [Winogradskyella sp.]